MQIHYFSPGLPFHVMRDHFAHGTEILGGMWDVRMEEDENRAEFREIMRQLMEAVGTSNTGLIYRVIQKNRIFVGGLYGENCSSLTP